YDALTGLGNRLLMRDRLSQAMLSGQKTNRRVAVLFIDLDRFKQVNDRFGHQIGDNLLIAAADRMKLVLRTEDSIFRQGGDEFVAILPNITNPRGIAFAAKRLVRELSQPYTISDKTIEIGASVGISIYPDDGVAIDSLLEAADAAMYQAKAAGRGRFFPAALSQATMSDADRPAKTRALAG
ncbi:MAG: GGDEF domain-containing protein, partial [Rhizobiaceae bacterium]|nr:GGDEF domain-containing protein [Rhizobiaceae bacterium]